MNPEYKVNIKFVQEIKKHPSLYDYTTTEYSVRPIVDNTWKEVGRQFNLTGAECKEKWKNLRSVYVRHVKKFKLGKPLKRRPYYLYKYMHFTLPFIKVPEIIKHYDEIVKADQEAVEEAGPSSPQGSSDSDSEDGLSSVEPPEKRIKIEDDVDADADANGDSNADADVNADANEDADTDTDTDQDQDVSGSQVERTDNSVDAASHQKANKMFLLSVLPDINRMDDRKRRMFKRRILEVIDDLLDEDNDEFRNKSKFYSIDV